MTYVTQYTSQSARIIFLCAIAIWLLPLVLHAQTSTSTATFQVSKVIDAAGFTGSLVPSDFSFSISGNGVNTTVEHDGTVELAVGTYTITESATNTFIPGEWTVLWAGDLCSGHYPATEAGAVVVTESDVEKNNPSNPYRCTAQNQYKPGTIKVVKEIVGTSTSPSQFSYSVNNSAPTAFDSSGIAFVEVPAGAYEVTEVAVDGYTTTYSASCTGTIANHENVTCTITNTYTDDDSGTGGNGGNGGDEDTYRIEGYVWHDDNENKEWDGFQDETATTTEDELTSWTVEITNGTDTFSTTTDAAGFYYFEVPAGTWAISEVVEDGWSITTPTDNQFVVTVPASPEVSTNVFQHIFSVLVPTAHAAVVETYGPYNFGNNQSGTDGGDGNNGGDSPSGGGGSSSPRCEFLEYTNSGSGHMLSWETRYGSDLVITQDGMEIYATSDDDEVDAGTILVTSMDATYVLTVSRGSRDDTCTYAPSTGGGSGAGAPDGMVLGDQVAIVPRGAADAGAGQTPLAPPQSAYMQVAALRSSYNRVRALG